MTGYAANQVVARPHVRKHRHQPRRYVALAIGMAICCLFLLAGAIGLTFAPGDDKAVEPDVVDHATGRILVVEPRHCREANFNNRTGQFHTNKTIPCPADGAANGQYQTPLNRLEGIRQGFFEER